jgi:hypothetical protein
MLAPSHDFTIDAADVGVTRPAFSDSKKSITAAPSSVQSSRPNWGKTWAEFLRIVLTYHSANSNPSIVLCKNDS